MICGVDPSTKHIAWAYSHRELFYGCGLVRVRHQEDPTPTSLAAAFKQTLLDTGFWGSLVIEIPQIYRQRLQKGDPNDLVQLALVAGAIAGAWGGAKFVLPAEWKGQRSKKVTTNRIVDRVLDTEELRILRDCLVSVPESLRHNVMDAVGIVLHEIGRF